MFTSARIRIHIRALSEQDIFVTRDLLGYGTRAAVDIYLSTLVKSQKIIRLARGVFVKAPSRLIYTLPTLHQVAEAKARAFNKKISLHGADVAKRLGIVAQGNTEPTYISDGCTTSFLCRGTRIHFKGAAPRKVNLLKTQQSSFIKALWHIGKARMNPKILAHASSSLGRAERRQLHESMAVMPTWMTQYFKQRLTYATPVSH